VSFLNPSHSNLDHLNPHRLGGRSRVHSSSYQRFLTLFACASLFLAITHHEHPLAAQPANVPATKNDLPPNTKSQPAAKTASQDASLPPLTVDFRYPLDLAVTSDGTCYVADLRLPGVWKFANGKSSIHFQAERKFRTPLNAVRCLAIDPRGELLAGDSSTREIYRFNKNGKPTPLTGGRIGLPTSIAVDAEGTIFVADLEANAVWKIPDAGGQPIRVATIPAPRGLATTPDGGLLVISHGPNQLLEISKNGETKVILPGRPFRFPLAIVRDDKGILYVADAYAKTIWRIAPGAKPLPWLRGDPLDHPAGLAFHDNTLWIVDPRAASIWTSTAKGQLNLKASRPAQKSRN